MIPNPRWKFVIIMILAIGIAPAASMIAQSSWQPGHESIGFGQPQGKQWVQMVSPQRLEVKSGGNADQPAELVLRFVIDTGLHINSHTPHSQYLIPTTLTLNAPAGIAVSKVDYPQGVDYHLAFDPNDALNVYTGAFGLLVDVRASRGEYVLQGHLRYQACDNRACNPPKNLPVTLNVSVQ
jgi:Disulphide bond corrector protein DsbC